MKALRTLAVGVTASATALVGLAPAATAAQAAVPAASEVAITQVVPGVMSLGGQFQVRLTLLQVTDTCSFDLYRDTSARGFEYLGNYASPRTTDLVSPSWGLLQYFASPISCRGNVGAQADSRLVFANVYDDDSAFVVSGQGRRVAQGGAYRNDMLRTTSRGARVRYTTGFAYNNALAVTTGPNGGVGTVYVNGVRRGTVSFYSTTLRHRQLKFNFGAAGPARRTIEIRQTGTGPRGGVQMYLDALTEIEQA